MGKLEKIIRYAIMPLKDSWEYSQEVISKGLNPKDYIDVFMMPARLKFGGAALAITLMLYGAAIYGCGKLTVCSYNKVKQELVYYTWVNRFSDVHTNMNIPKETNF